MQTNRANIWSFRGEQKHNTCAYQMQKQVDELRKTQIKILKALQDVTDAQSRLRCVSTHCQTGFYAEIQSIHNAVNALRSQKTAFAFEAQKLFQKFAKQADDQADALDAVQKILEYNARALLMPECALLVLQTSTDHLLRLANTNWFRSWSCMPNVAISRFEDTFKVLGKSCRVSNTISPHRL